MNKKNVWTAENCKLVIITGMLRLLNANQLFSIIYSLHVTGCFILDSFRNFQHNLILHYEEKAQRWNRSVKSVHIVGVHKTDFLLFEKAALDSVGKLESKKPIRGHG